MLVDGQERSPVATMTCFFRRARVVVSFVTMAMNTSLLLLLLFALLQVLAIIPFVDSFVTPPCSRRHKPFAPAFSSSSALAMSADFQLPPETTALVLIEYQNEFTTPGGKLHDAVKESMQHNNMLENSIKLTKFCREAGCKSK